MKEVRGGAREPRGATGMCFWVLLIEISSRKAVPEVTSTFPGPLHNMHCLAIVAEQVQYATGAAPGKTCVDHQRHGFDGKSFLPLFAFFEPQQKHMIWHELAWHGMVDV